MGYWANFKEKKIVLDILVIQVLANLKKIAIVNFLNWYFSFHVLPYLGGQWIHVKAFAQVDICFKHIKVRFKQIKAN